MRVHERPQPPSSSRLADSVDRWTLSGRRSWRLAAAVLGGPLLVSALAHCVDGTFADGQFLCDPASGEQACPAGQSCAADGVCRLSSLEPDAGLDAGLDAATDAATDAASDACVPQTCADLLPACAADSSDGCGGELDCTAACLGSATCGGGGASEQCGCAPLESQVGRPGRVYAIEQGQLNAVWENLDAGLVQDGVAVTTPEIRAGSYTDLLVFDHLNLNVPAGARVHGIVVRAWRSTVLGVPNACTFHTMKVELKWGADDQAPQVSMTMPDTEAWLAEPDGSDALRSYGTENQTWSVDWTPEQVNQPDFGLLVQARCIMPNGQPDDSTYRSSARVDYAELTLYYEPACD